MKDCKTPYCRNRSVKGSRYCSKCRSRQYKKSHPFRYFFNAAKNNARRRGIPWGLTFEQWKQIWVDSGHWNDKLNQAGNDDVTWTLDRDDVNLGYVDGNVQVMEKIRNVQKWFEEDRFNINVTWRKRWSENNDRPIEECPF